MIVYKNPNINGVLLKAVFLINANGRKFQVEWEPLRYDIIYKNIVTVSQWEESSFPQKEPSEFIQIGDKMKTRRMPSNKSSLSFIANCI